MAFEPAATLIGLREGMEILLVVGVLLGILSRLGAKDKAWTVWAGVGAGVLVSGILGIVILSTLGAWFEQRGGAEAFEVFVALAAVGVLTYMVLWMQKHAHTMVSQMKEKVEVAVTTGSWFAIGALAFFTVLREGLEVVLFFSALAADASWFDIIWSGIVGFGVSAVIALALFRFMVKVDVKRFFAVSGFLIILIAAGLLVHVAHAASDLGWLPHGEPLWDTSGVLPDEDHWLGGPLHAFIGYEDQPTALQLLAYLAYIAGVGGWYATRLASADKRDRTKTGAIAVLVLLLAVFALGGAVAGGNDAHDDDTHSATHAQGPPDHNDVITAADAVKAYEGKIGLLIRQHGEWIHYNASTYESVKDFVRGIWPYTGLPPELLTVDDGTYYLDDAHPFSTDLHADPTLVDAWLDAGDLPAVPINDDDADGVVAALADGPVWFKPGAGSGMGEPDIFEMAGIGVYRTWLKMDNESPMYGTVKRSWDYLATHIEKHYGDKVVAEFAFHVDPKVDPSETVEAAAQRLADAGVDVVFDVYQSSVHSDSMDTCMMRPHSKHALRDAGFEGPILDTVRPAGLTTIWADGVADYVVQLLERYDPTTPVSIQLSQHGGTPGNANPCGEGADKYHQQTKAEFAFALAAITERTADRPAPVTVHHVYGQGAGAADDGVLSPREALAMDQQAGIKHSLVIPYEFWGNAMDNLVPLREALGFNPDRGAYYDEDYESTGTYRNVRFTIVSADFSLESKASALLAQIDAALADYLADPTTAPTTGPESSHVTHDGAHVYQTDRLGVVGTLS